jgi:alpha-glucosidase
MTRSADWWRSAVIYQILVVSYRDTDGDGYGDLPGIIEKLDYLHWLGVDAVWLTPIYSSPMLEMGYDVSDYCDVNPQFGTLADVDRLIAEAHARGIKVLLDWVGSHTSDQHPWFVESRSSRDNPRRDWYLWRDAEPDGSPPSNWISTFGGSVWEWDPRTEQYYFHSFLSQQPDLNWRNPEVRAALHESLRFWLERGVDGFRLDAVCLMLKDPHWRDNPPNPDFRPAVDGPDSAHLPRFTRDQPGLHDLVADLRQVVDEFDSKVLLGELYLPLERIMAYYGGRRPELHLPMNMPFAWNEWKAETIAGGIRNVRQALPSGAWPSWTLSSHDIPRLGERLPPGQLRVAAMLLLTLQGTPTLYYGEEIGMRGVKLPAKTAQDPQGRRTGRNRDPERTPMQWHSRTGAGFTTGRPWLPIGSDLATASVESQSSDERSLLNLYRRLLRVRREVPAILQGRFELLDEPAPLIAWQCRSPDENIQIALNLGDEELEADLVGARSGSIILSTGLDRPDEAVEGRVSLRPGEGVIVRLSP